MQTSASIQPRTSPSKFGGKLFNIIHSRVLNSGTKFTGRPDLRFMRASERARKELEESGFLSDEDREMHANAIRVGLEAEVSRAGRLGES